MVQCFHLGENRNNIGVYVYALRREEGQELIRSNLQTSSLKLHTMFLSNDEMKQKTEVINIIFKTCQAYFLF